MTLLSLRSALPLPTSIISVGTGALTRCSPSAAHHSLGLAISIVAAGLNGGVALIVVRVGNRLRSITLRTDPHALLTDVWRSGGVIVAVVPVALTGWRILDPFVTLLLAANIVWVAIRLLRDPANGILTQTA